jgi:hypothetical protein
VFAGNQLAPGSFLERGGSTPLFCFAREIFPRQGTGGNRRLEAWQDEPMP